MTPSNPVYFQFEADFVESLRCIPMQVRYKLDTCGVKLKLHHWHEFSTEERQQLVSLPCDQGSEVSQYRDYLQSLVVAHTGSQAKELAIDPTPPWADANQIPADVQTKLQEVGATLSLEQWQQLSPLQRFALIKLSRPSHENRNFLPALQEFGLSV
jgi:hypothetical protein